MSNHILVLLLGWPALVGVCAFAWVKGDAPARISGGLMLIVALLAWLIVHNLPFAARAIPMLAVDGLLAFGFLLTAFRYVSLWLGAAMVLQGLEFSLHAYYMVMARPHDLLYQVINNLVTYAIMVCILTGTVIAWRRRTEAQRKQPLAQSTVSGASGPASS